MLYNVQCTLHLVGDGLDCLPMGVHLLESAPGSAVCNCSVRCQTYGLQCAEYGLKCALCSARFAVCVFQCGMCSVRFEVDGLHCVV